MSRREPSTRSPVTTPSICSARILERGDLKVMWVQVTNPWVTIPNLHRYERDHDDDTFVIVSGHLPDPDHRGRRTWCLPAAAWIEREGVFGNSERRTQQWFQLVDPPGDAREDAWQIIEVAKRMGYENLFPWPEDDWHEPMFEEYRRIHPGHGA